MTKKILLVNFCLLIAMTAQAAPVDQQIEKLNQQITDLTEIISRLEARVAALETALGATSEPGAAEISESAGQSGQTGNWRNGLKWKLLQKGMNPDQVRGLLGEPANVVTNIRYVMWKYGEGNVKFNRAGDAVISWKTP
jgi:uncharacterized coiled-coil protein SlyX